MEDGSYGRSVNRKRIATKVSFGDESSGTNLEVWRGGGVWWGKSKQEEEKRGAGMLAFPFIFSSTEFREAAERGPETGKIPFLWSKCVLECSDGFNVSGVAKTLKPFNPTSDV